MILRWLYMLSSWRRTVKQLFCENTSSFLQIQEFCVLSWLQYVIYFLSMWLFWYIKETSQSITTFYVYLYARCKKSYSIKNMEYIFGLLVWIAWEEVFFRKGCTTKEYKTIWNLHLLSLRAMMGHFFIQSILKIDITCAHQNILDLNWGIWLSCLFRGWMCNRVRWIVSASGIDLISLFTNVYKSLQTTLCWLFLWLLDW